MTSIVYDLISSSVVVGLELLQALVVVTLVRLSRFSTSSHERNCCFHLIFPIIIRKTKDTTTQRQTHL